MRVDANLQQNVTVGVDPQEAMAFAASAAAALSAAEQQNQELRHAATQELQSQQHALRLEAEAALQQQQQAAAASEERLRQEAHAAWQQKQSHIEQQVSAAMQQQQQQAAATQQQAAADLQRVQQEARSAAESRDKARAELEESEGRLKQQRENFHQLRHSELNAQARERESRDEELKRAREAYEDLLRQKEQLEVTIQTRQGQGGMSSAADASSLAPASHSEVVGSSQQTARAKGTSSRRSTSGEPRGKHASRSRGPASRKTNGPKSDATSNSAAVSQHFARPVAPPPNPPFRNPDWLEKLIERTRKARELGVDVTEMPPALPDPLNPERPGLLPSAVGGPPPPAMPKRNVTFGVTPDRFGYSQNLDNSSYVFGPPRDRNGGDDIGGQPPGQDPPRRDYPPPPGGNGNEDEPEDEDEEDDDDDDDDYWEDEEEERILEEGEEEEDFTDDECVIPEEVTAQDGADASRRAGPTKEERDRSPRRSTPFVPAPPPLCPICGGHHGADRCPHRCAICAGPHRTEEHPSNAPPWSNEYWRQPFPGTMFTGSGGYPGQVLPQVNSPLFNLNCEDPEYKRKQQEYSQQQPQHPPQFSYFTGHPYTGNNATTTSQAGATADQSNTAQPKKKTKAASSAKASLAILKPEKEERYVRVKDVNSIKTHNLPTDSANVRGWKAVNIPVWNSFDISSEGYLAAFVDQGIKARGKQLERLKYQDGISVCPFPRFNRNWGASFMTSQNLRHPELGEPLQDYSEECQRGSYPISGQYCVGLVCRYFDVEKSRGAVMSEVQLLSLELSGNGIDALHDFKTRFTLIKSQ
ncbi:MAG: hypothetical protein ACR2M9_03140, partial [Cyanophyceae cyanobacterium]